MSCLNYKKNTFNIQQLTRLKEDSCYKTNNKYKVIEPYKAYTVQQPHKKEKVTF